MAPSAMASARMAPDTEDRPDARLFVRGFGAHQLAAGAMALGSLRWQRLERPAMAIAVPATRIIAASRSMMNSL